MFNTLEKKRLSQFKNKVYFIQRTKLSTTEILSEASYINGLGKDLDKVCSTIKDL